MVKTVTRKIKPRLGPDFALISKKNRVFLDRKKEANKKRCRKMRGFYEW